MIDRKTYLEMCRQNALKAGKVKVKHKGREYFPYAYQLSFAKDGSIIHTAILTERPNMLFYCLLKDLESV